MAESLYIHIPFCARKCIYCDFLSVPYDDALAGRYTGALCRELELKKDLAGVLKTVYIGGGTPSILPEKSLEDISRISRDVFINIGMNFAELIWLPRMKKKPQEVMYVSKNSLR